MKRLLVEAMPDLPRELRYFRCQGCGTVIPESQCSERERAFLAEKRGRCDQCEGG